MITHRCSFNDFLDLISQVSALAVSKDGSLVASGQIGTRNFKGNAAPVFVWDMESRRRIIALRGEGGGAQTGVKRGVEHMVQKELCAVV